VESPATGAWACVQGECYRREVCILLGEQLSVDLSWSLGKGLFCVQGLWVQLLQRLHGQVFLTNYQAIQTLTPEIIQPT
jgi:hypothetical protein